MRGAGVARHVSDRGESLSIGETIGIKGSVKPFPMPVKDEAQLLPPVMLNGAGQPSQLPGRNGLRRHNREQDFG